MWFKFIHTEEEGMRKNLLPKTLAGSHAGRKDYKLMRDIILYKEEEYCVRTVG